MSNYSYGFDSGPERRSGSSRLRFTLIFILISAVTAALVWWFWPRSGKEKTVSGKKETQTVSVNAAQGSGSVPSDVGEKTFPAGKAGGESVAAPPSAGKTAGEAAGKKAALPDPSDPPLPAKGVMTPADQKGTDLPEIAVAEKTDPLREEALKKAAALLAEKQFADAEKFAEQALAGAAENTLFYRNAWRVLSAARVEGIYGGKSRWLVPCRINSGDTLSAIASKHNTTVELLRKSNKISGSRIYVGRTLCVPPAGAWRIVVSKKSRLLRLYFKEKGREESLFGLWEIGVGRMGKTPSADFAVAARVRHPDWYLPDGRVFKYGDAENQLGEYFLKLAPAGAPGKPLLGYGIHGARDESAVGRSLSNGCVRMRNADVEALYYLVPSGTGVAIREN